MEEYFPHLALAAFVLLVVVILWRFQGRSRFSRTMPYTKRRSLLTDGEMRFYCALLPAVPSGLVVMVKVRLMDVLSVPDDAWREYGAPGSGMHLDFVLADASTLEPRLVIELDDKTHQWQSSQVRDQFKDAALASAGLPVLRVKVAGRYDRLRERIAEAMG